MMRLPFKKLLVWQKSIELVDAIYAVTRTFPKGELHCLTPQMQRAAISVASNIAEGSQRTSDKDFAHFLLTAKGSLAELETQVYIAQRQAYATTDQLDRLLMSIDELSRMLRALHTKVFASSRFPLPTPRP